MIINDLDGYYIVFDTKNWNTELDTLVNRTYFKITIPHPYVLKGYYCGIGFMFYGIMVILDYMI